ncbi:RNA-directed DNA polymerase, eukaryota [Canna indica]|uniref:RNA-directed DNA polymerase, eukaryota n=1 Tax=Canna indica TaxID=4628 RepID=A0AAQ3Q2H7_9LILI|nr:RNA-directed DNA polymerase, eukaryota [Canna indica]
MEYEELEIIKSNWQCDNSSTNKIEGLSLNLTEIGKKVSAWVKKNIFPLEKELKIAKDELDEWNLVEDLNWKKLSNKRRRDLCKDFTEAEVWNVVNSLGMGKAPGPDGFNTEFCIRYWSILKDYIQSLQ